MDTDAKTTVTSATTNPTAEQDTIASPKHFVVERPVPRLVKSNGQSSIEWTAKATEVDPPANTEVIEANLGQFFTKVFKENDLTSRSTSKTYLRVVESPSHAEQDLDHDYGHVLLRACLGCYTGPYKFGDEEEDDTLLAGDGNEVPMAKEPQS